MSKLDLLQTNAITGKLFTFLLHQVQLHINAHREQFFLLITDVVNALSKTVVL